MLEIGSGVDGFEGVSKIRHAAEGGVTACEPESQECGLSVDA